MIKTRHQKGFTLVELLVAFFIMSMIMVFTYQIFFTTTEAVRLGIAQSHVIGTVRATMKQITNDTDRMLGPDTNLANAGMLMIIQNEITVPVYDSGRGGRGAAGTTRTMRSDQLIFFARSSPDYRPLVPESEDTFLGYTPTPPLSDSIRIFYGHGQRTNADGTLTGNPLGSLSDPYAAHEMILSRQVLHLGLTATNVATDPTYVDGVEYNSTVRRGFADDANLLAHFGGADSIKLYHGLADVSSSQWQHATLAAVIGPAGNGNKLLFDTPIYGALAPGENIITYRDEAMKLTFTDASLQVNPVPLVPSPSSVANYLESWQVAQTHANFAAHVSDVIIEFVADTNNDGLPNRDPYDPTALCWYGSDLDDVNYAAASAGAGFENVTNWGAAPIAADSSPRVQTALVVANLSANAKAYVFRHNDVSPPGPFVADTPANSKWPAMIRMRYRIHDPRNRITSEGTVQRGDVNSFVGALIRIDATNFDIDANATEDLLGMILYVTNPSTGLVQERTITGYVASTATEHELTVGSAFATDPAADAIYEIRGRIPGVWYEQVIKVNRPSY